MGRNSTFRCAVACVGASFWLAAFVALAPLHAGELRFRATVLVSNYSAVPAGTLRLAEVRVAAAFRKAGIQIAWTECDFYRRPHEPCRAGEQVQNPIDFFMNLLPADMALFLAMPPDRLGGVIQQRAFVLYDRVVLASQQVPGSHVPIASVLGYVMTHELGHMIRGDDRHALEGIMRPAFRAGDCTVPMKNKCLFTDDESERMQAQLKLLRPR